jgi:hypothetical protein
MAINVRRYGVEKILVVAVLFFTVLFSWLDPIDSQANQQVDDGLQRALVTFASARALNALISVAQGTEVAVHPFGFGMNLTVGQILDPVNDLVEQFSDLMLVACVAFGVQKVLLTVGASWIVSLLFTGIAVIWVSLYLSNKSRPAWITRAMITLVVIRFALPLSLVGSGLVFDGVLKTKYDHGYASIQSLDTASAQNDFVEEHTVSATQNSADESQKKPGFFARLFGQRVEKDGASDPSIGETGAESLQNSEKQSFWSKLNPKKRIENLKQSIEKMTERIIDLMVVFVCQTILMPLVFLWLFISVARGSTVTEALAWVKSKTLQ